MTLADEDNMSIQTVIKGIRQLWSQSMDPLCLWQCFHYNPNFQILDCLFLGTPSSIPEVLLYLLLQASSACVLVCWSAGVLVCCCIKLETVSFADQESSDLLIKLREGD